METIIMRLLLEAEYENQSWGYLIAYEDDIEKSESWDDLKSFSYPASNTINRD